MSLKIAASLAVLLTIAAIALGANEQLQSSNDYYFSTTTVSFTQAWAYCKNANTKFVSITSEAQNVSLTNALTSLGAPSTQFWTGGLFLKNGFLAKWYWVDGQEDVSVDLPTITSSSDYCLSYNYNATTHESVLGYDLCNNVKYFICQF